MAKNLKTGERVTVDRIVDFDPASEPFINGLPQISVGQVGVVVDAAPTGRASIVDFDGIQATVSNQRLQRLDTPPAKGKRGRKKRATSAPAAPKAKRTTPVQTSSTDETSEQVITQLANTLLLNGGLKQNDDVVIQLRFDELPESVKTQIRKLIDAKLALSRTALK